MRTARYQGLWVVALAVLGLSACSETQLAIHSAKRVVGAVDQQKPAPGYKVGNSYQISGTWYYPKEDYGYDETGIASWYGTKFHGRRTANGEIYDMNTLTAAHRTLPMPSYVRVTNLENGRSMVLKVNDRGPFAKGRIIDISRRGSQLLGFQKKGTAKVRVQILADKSRALAVRMQNQIELANVGSPITIKRLPKAKVTGETLAPPEGAKASEPVVAARAVPPPQNAPLVRSAPPAPAANSISRVAPEPTNGTVIQTPVGASNIFVQAGAFGQYDNANKVRARLSSVGPVNISNVLVNGRDLYRVRVGPLASVAEADRMMGSVVRAGYKSARIIVE
ncbi:MAG: septal ring lytic transglycosylase RlpA family protein [Rhodospirillaceae bacterium]|nr:septal ring lytic transglycosylase RlpA family protein [Rhodospirillaceae bacterium]MBT5513867.1 septal ring lytic transglycosylase RlpA family protein [Rhodospirillaceae bacterium]MBT6608618.1 septal ring lytic transglycosylase RlpA family protein [Rhodospirillaceae bacterium]MBT7249447.1 septal ring lytic transglycosylase RlpA family protein [Rhodospirillaceae bacterium]MBT7511640.1 septal ring lytic transglycosylase RlpA family protein [Rhodospirillaceae bacterium]